MSTDRLAVEATPRGVSEARRGVLALAPVQGLGSAERQDVALIVSELVSNAVLAATPGSTVTVRVDARAGSLTIEVVNAGPPAPVAIGWSLPAPDAPSGRGLAIVEQLCTDVTLVSAGGHTTVRAVYVTQIRHRREEVKSWT